MNNKQLEEKLNKESALNFYKNVTGKDKAKFFEHIDNEQFIAIKKAFTVETRLRSKNCYYRFECSLTDTVNWCVESNLSSNINSKAFKKQLKLLGIKRLANRNTHSEIYVHAQTANKPYLSAEELELGFQQDVKGKASQVATLTSLGQRPSKLNKLIH